MKRLVTFCLIITLLFSLFSLFVSSQETVFFGNFEPITFSVGLGSKEKLINGISAIDPHTNEDITDTVVDSTGKSWGQIRKVSVVALDSDVEYINIDHGRNYLESIDFEMIKNTDFELHYLLYSENYEKLLYSWCFTGEDIYNPPRRMSVTITGESENIDAIKNGVGQAKFQILNFEYKDRFPSRAEVFFSVNEEFGVGTSLYLYSYGETEGFKLIDDGIIINDVYYASCFFEKGGEYVLTDKKIGYSSSNLTQFTSSANQVDPDIDDTESQIHTTPGFNEENSQIEQEKEIFNDLQKNIYLTVLIVALAAILISFIVFLIFKKRV